MYPFPLFLPLWDNYKGKFIIQLFNRCLPLYQEVLRKSALLPLQHGHRHSWWYSRLSVLTVPAHPQAEPRWIRGLSCRYALESKIATKEEEIRTLKARLSNIVRQHEFATVQDFYTTFYTAQRAFDAYQKERSKWEEAYGEIVTPKFETIHDKIKRYQEKSDNQNANRPYQSKDKGGEIIAPQFHCLIFSKMKFRTLIIKKSH